VKRSGSRKAIRQPMRWSTSFSCRPGGGGGSIGSIRQNHPSKEHHRREETVPHPQSGGRGPGWRHRAIANPMGNCPKDAERSFRIRTEEASRSELERWFVDPGCTQGDLEANELVGRRNPSLRRAELRDRSRWLSNTRSQLSIQEPKFPRCQVHRRSHRDEVVTIFVLLPFITALVVYLLR
jgi:hypothetical protein